MLFKIETEKLKKILTKVSKGVGNGKVLPVTQYLKVELLNRVLSITATDLNLFITVKTDNISGTNGVILVQADKLIKLVEKTTVPEMEFEATDGSINVHGNGKYKIPYIEGEFPTFTFDKNVDKVEISNAKLQEMFKVNKSAVAITQELPCLTGYNVGEKCITTDGVKMCINKVKLLNDKTNILISKEMSDLLTTIEDEKVNIQIDGNRLLFTTDSMSIFGAELAGREQYPDISGILDFEYGAEIFINKLQFTNALERISLFVDKFDNFSVVLEFLDQGLKISDLKKANYELVKYVKKDRFKPSIVTCNLPYLQGLLNVTPSEETSIEYDNENSIRIKDGNIYQILCLMRDEGGE